MGRDGRLLIIDNSDSFTRNLAQMAEEEGAGEVVVAREELLDPGMAAGFHRILISPGPGLPSDFPRMLEVIRRFSSDHSILGICLGLQAIAEVFGGKLIRMEEVRHGMTAEIKVHDPPDKIFKGLPVTFPAGLYHSWTVDPEHLPPALKVTALSREGYIMAVRHEAYSLCGLQFHPESIMTPQGRRLLNNWLFNG
jgi:anthranilate synthase component II